MKKGSKRSGTPGLVLRQGVHYFRYSVPPDCREGLAVAEVWKSLETKDAKLASIRWGKLREEWDAKVSECRRMALRAYDDHEIDLIADSFLESLHSEQVHIFESLREIETSFRKWSEDFPSFIIQRLDKDEEYYVYPQKLKPADRNILLPRIAARHLRYLPSQLRLGGPANLIRKEVGELASSLPNPNMEKPQPVVPKEIRDIRYLLEGWKNEKGPRPRTYHEFSRACDLFVASAANSILEKYDPTDVRLFQKTVLDLRYKGEPLKFTTREKLLNGIKAIFNYGVRKGIIRKSPAQGIVFERPKVARNKTRTGWREENLQPLFNSPVFKEGLRPKGGAGQAAYWLPVLSLYSGARLGELSQLKVADISVRDKIRIIEIRNTGDDQSVKTESSKRIIPIHDYILDLGFEKYYQTLDRGGQLFPLIKMTRLGNWGVAFGQWFKRYRKGIGILDDWEDFHALRHTFKTGCRAAALSEDVSDALTGHSRGSIGRGYGIFPVSVLRDAINKVKFDVEIPCWTIGSPPKRTR